MIATHELLVLEAGGPAAGALTPGAVLRALALGAGIRAEEVATILPLGRGSAQVEIAVSRAARLATPLPIPIDDGRTRVLMTLRREDDPPEDALSEVAVYWTDGGPPPAPGALATALSDALRGAAGAESLGAAFFGDGWGRLALPASLTTSPRLPATLEVAGRRFELTPAGKKKP